MFDESKAALDAGCEVTAVHFTAVYTRIVDRLAKLAEGVDGDFRNFADFGTEVVDYCQHDALFTASLMARLVTFMGYDSARVRQEFAYLTSLIMPLVKQIDAAGDALRKDDRSHQAMEARKRKWIEAVRVVNLGWDGDDYDDSTPDAGDNVQDESAYTAEDIGGAIMYLKKHGPWHGPVRVRIGNSQYGPYVTGHHVKVDTDDDDNRTAMIVLSVDS